MKKENKVIKLNANNDSGGVNAPSEFEFKGIAYRLVDFENEFDLEQETIAKPLIANMLREIFLSVKTKNLNDDELLVGVACNSLELQFDSELVALIFLQKDEEEFNIETYEDRIIKFKKLRGESLEIAKRGLQSFFTLKVPSLISSSQTSLGAINGIGQ